MNDKLKGLLLASVILLSSLGGAVAVTGAALAQDGTSTATPTDTSNDGAEMLDQTVSVDNSTEEVWLEALDTSGDSLNYEVLGVSDGQTTEVDTGTISSASDAEEATRLTWAADSSAYDSYRVIVTEDPSDADTESAESLQIGTTVSQAAGGGGFFGGGGSGLFSTSNILIGVALLGGAYVAGLLDPVEEWIQNMG